MKATLLLLCAVAAYGNTTSVNKSHGLTIVNSVSGAAGLQWSVSLPFGVFLNWTTTVPGKTVQCNSDGSTCILIGNNTNPIPTGVVATASLTWWKKAVPPAVISLLSQVGATPDGIAASTNLSLGLVLLSSKRISNI